MYRPRTDEFAEARKSKRNAGKIEQTRLERRLEKLINLHFSEPSEKPKAPQPPPVRQRKSSLFKDLSDLRGKSASELWKDMITSQAQGEKNDIRGEELSVVVNYHLKLMVLRVQLLSRGSHRGKRTPLYRSVRFVCEPCTRDHRPRH